MRNIELRIVNYFTANDAGPGDDKKVGLVKNYEALELFENQPINITLQSQDLRNPITRRLSYSGSFKVPATSKNNRLLAWSYLINNTQGFLNDNEAYDINIFNLPVKAQLYIDGFYVFDGELQLTNIDRGINGINYDVTFILSNYSFFTLLKDVKFGDPYFARPTDPSIISDEPLIPANWIWDSIILESYTQSGSNATKKNLFPVIPFNNSNTFPKATNRDLTSFINYAFDSWSFFPNAKIDKHYWGYIDDGKTPVYNFNLVTTDVNARNIRDGSFVIKSLSSNNYTKLNSFSLFENVRPYYYVGDVVRRVFRFLEYKLNTEVFLTDDVRNMNIINFPNYNNPGYTYSNFPIKFFFDEESDILNDWDNSTPTLLDRLVMITPENTQYVNPEIRVVVIPDLTNSILVQQSYSGEINVERFPIDYLPNGSNWDKENGVMFFSIRNIISQVGSATSPASINVKVYFNDVLLADKVYNYSVGSGGVDNTVTFNLILNSNSYTSTLNDPTNVKTILTNANQLENYIYTYVHYEDLDLLYTGDTGAKDYTSENTNINFGYDLRRYLYPSLSEYNMSDFLVDVFRLFNAKVESPIFASLVTGSDAIDTIQIDTYALTLSDAKLVDLTPYVDFTAIKKRQQFYKDFTLSYRDNGDELSKNFTDNFKPALPYGSKYINYNSVEGYAQNSLKIELKSSMPTFISTGNTINKLGKSFGIPSVYDIKPNPELTITGTNQTGFRSLIYECQAVDGFTPFFLFTSTEQEYNFTSGTISIDKRLFTNKTTITSNKHFLPYLLPVDYDLNYSLLYDYPDSLLTDMMVEILDDVPESGYETFYEEELNSLQGSSIIEANIDLSLIDLLKLRFQDIYTLRIDGEFSYYRLNKLTNYDLTEQKKARIELIEYDYITNQSELYGPEFYLYSDINQSKNANYLTSFQECAIGTGATNATLVYNESKDFLQNVKLRKQGIYTGTIPFTFRSHTGLTLSATYSDTGTYFTVRTFENGTINLTKY